MVVKLNDSGAKVREIQNLLKSNGCYSGIIDGKYGPKTKERVEIYQKKVGIVVDGVVGPKTYEKLLAGIDTDGYGLQISNKYNINYYGQYYTDCKLKINKAYLDGDEYVRDYGIIEPKSLYIHHTSGWDDPYNVVNGWNNDKLGRVGTQYIIGGTNIKGESKFDGEVVQTFPDGYIAWHLGKVGNFDVSKYSVGIELNNFGYLTLKNGKYYNYVGIEVPEEQVVDLGYKFRGYRYWHKYSDKQIDNLKGLIYHIKRVYPTINIKEGLPKDLEHKHPREAFEFNKEVYNGSKYGLYTHTNVRKDKFDCSPQKNLVDMLKSIK